MHRWEIPEEDLPDVAEPAGIPEARAVRPAHRQEWQLVRLSRQLRRERSPNWDRLRVRANSAGRFRHVTARSPHTPDRFARCFSFGCRNPVSDDAGTELRHPPHRRRAVRVLAGAPPGSFSCPGHPRFCRRSSVGCGHAEISTYKAPSALSIQALARDVGQRHGTQRSRCRLGYRDVRSARPRGHRTGSRTRPDRRAGSRDCAP